MCSEDIHERFLSTENSKKMIDIFLQKDVKKLLANKNVVFIGDSNIRALYKDLLCLIHQNTFIPVQRLKLKGESSCFGDKLISRGPRYNGREYKEERVGSHIKTEVSFYFICRVYDKYVKGILDKLSKDPRQLPDVLIINSCLWDVTRWGPNGVELYKKNLVLLLRELKKRLPDCLVIWVTAPPIACEIKGGFLVKEIEFLKYSIRFHVMEANHYARKVVVDHGFDVLDSHYHLKLQIHRREGDGIHWGNAAVRYITNLLLTHISIAWNVSLPHRFKSTKLEESLNTMSEEEDTIEPEEDKKKHISMVQSVIVKPNDEEKCKSNEVKRKTKNFSPKRKIRKKSLGERNANFQESHHSYLKRVENKQRHVRIRQRNKHAERTTFQRDLHEPNTHFPSYNSQQDSGYLSRPNPAPYNQQMFIDSPRHISISQSSFPHKMTNDTYKPWTHTTQPMYDTMSQVRNVQMQPSRSHANYLPQVLRQTIPYNSQLPDNNWLSFQPRSSHVNNWVHSNPIIDFASTDAVPFGLQF